MRNNRYIFVVSAICSLVCFGGCGSSPEATQEPVINDNPETIEAVENSETNVNIEADDNTQIVDMGEYVSKVSMGDIDGNGTEDFVTVLISDGQEPFGGSLGDILNIWLNNEKIYTFKDELPICSIGDNFQYMDLDGDGREELFISFEPMVNSMPLTEYLVLKNTGNEWNALNLVNDKDAYGENEGDSNSFPISVVRGGKNPIYTIGIDGYEGKIVYDAKSHYANLTVESKDNEYEHNIYTALLTGDESIDGMARENGCASAWGIWDIGVDQVNDENCLLAEQGIQGPYGKFDSFGTLYIRFKFDTAGKIIILNTEMLLEDGTILQEAATDMNYSMDDFYISEITDEIFDRIYGISYKEDCYVPREDLRYLHLLYKDIEGNTHYGELIVNEYIAEDVLDIFKTLYEADYPFERIELIDKYNADDDLSILNNNTSAFNFRCIGSTNKISKHGLGLAIDINPFYNPYIKKVDGVNQIDPVEASAYGDRSADYDYKIDENNLLYQLFTQKGFNWGGNWKNTKDYQHFEVSTDTVKALYPQWTN